MTNCEKCGIEIVNICDYCDGLKLAKLFCPDCGLITVVSIPHEWPDRIEAQCKQCLND